MSDDFLFVRFNQAHILHGFSLLERWLVGSVCPVHEAHLEGSDLNKINFHAKILVM